MFLLSYNIYAPKELHTTVQGRDERYLRKRLITQASDVSDSCHLN